MYPSAALNKGFLVWGLWGGMWTSCNQPVFFVSYGPAACFCKSLYANNKLQKMLTRASPVCRRRRDRQRALLPPRHPALCSTHLCVWRAGTALGNRWGPGTCDATGGPWCQRVSQELWAAATSTFYDFPYCFFNTWWEMAQSFPLQSLSQGCLIGFGH